MHSNVCVKLVVLSSNLETALSKSYADFQKPLFKKGMQFLSELKTDMILTGRVTNVVLFGAFVDLGVGINGLIHISKMRPPLKYAENLGLGDHVEVKICSVDAQRKRIALQLLRLLHL